MAGWPILSLTTFLPLVGAAFILLIRGEPDVVARNARNVALWTSLITFTLLYAALAVIELRLLVRYAKAGPQPEPVASTDDVDGERPLAFAY